MDSYNLTILSVLIQQPRDCQSSLYSHHNKWHKTDLWSNNSKL